MKTEKKKYEAPQLTVVTFKTEQGYATSSLGASGAFGLGDAWSNESSDAWDGSSSSSGNRFGGGWTDNGGSAWE